MREFNGHRLGMRPLRATLLGLSLALGACAAADEPAPAAARWNPAQLQRLAEWARAAPQDALPVPDMRPLAAAMADGTPDAIDRAADALALGLARQHLLGATDPARRVGWWIVDGDRAVNLEARLAAALAPGGGGADAFLDGLDPQHPDYAALKAALARETDPARRLAIARNMDRWRWLPRALGQDHIMVNVPAFEVSLWRGGTLEKRWPVITGKPSTPSPAFDARVTGVTFNPWWDIPASIVRERGGVFSARAGYVHTQGGWRQRPGPGNSLGQMKLVMPNRFNVYLHDTPSKSLFARPVRAFSHGCIRVSDPFDFAARLLAGVRTRGEIDALVAKGDTVSVALAAPLPVYVAYFTAVPGSDGSIRLLPDIYGRDAALPLLATTPSAASPSPGAAPAG